MLAGFALLYTAAAALGRRTVVEGGDVSMVWPAAGVSVIWLVGRARRPWLWLDLVVMALATALVSGLTGTGWSYVLLGAVPSVVQALAAAIVISRRVPRVWASRGRRELARVDELWWLLLAGVLGAVLSAPVLSLMMWLASGLWPTDVALLWCVRNTVSILTVGLLGITIGDWRRRRAERAAEGALAPSRALRRSRVAEYLAALVLAPALYVLWFIGFGDLALVFPLIALTVWAGSRLATPFVVLHNTAMGCTAVTLTLLGSGPFVTVDGTTLQVAVAQLYVGLVSFIGMALALARDERTALVRELGTARDRAQSQAALLTTIVDTMSEGVRVVDRHGRVLVRNPAATRLLVGVPNLEAASAPTPGSESGECVDLAGLFRLDGTPLTEDELPYRQVLAGGQVRDVDLLVRTPGSPGPRIVSFSSVPLPEESGGGAVSVLRDVTAEREELRRAAQIQASLLPTSIPTVPGYELAARFVPAGSVGGDFYDWQQVPGGVVVTLADVMGKGPGAAILAATTRSVLHAREAGPDVVATLAATERAMEQDLANAGAFVTMFRVHLDAGSGALTYADAGHGLTMILRADGSSERLTANGLPLGIVLGGERTSSAARLDRGDLLLMCSDGVLDAVGGSMSDLDRVVRIAGAAGSADRAVEAVLGMVEDTGSQPDDLTVVALLRTAR
ncbi:MAG TPA: SpoIIE family protein phosphatase [Cellulomonas sp.]